jgi:hypothetical protein
MSAPPTLLRHLPDVTRMIIEGRISRQSELINMIDLKYPRTEANYGNIIFFINCAVAQASVSTNDYSRAVETLGAVTHYASKHYTNDIPKPDWLLPKANASVHVRSMFENAAANEHSHNALTEAKGIPGVMNTNKHNNESNNENNNTVGAGGKPFSKGEFPNYKHVFPAKPNIRMSKYRDPNFVFANLKKFRYFIVGVHGRLPTNRESPILSVPANTIVLQTGAGNVCGRPVATTFDTHILPYFSSEGGLIWLFANLLGIKHDPILQTISYAVEGEETVDKQIRLYDADFRGPGIWGIFEVNNDYVPPTPITLNEAHEAGLLPASAPASTGVAAANNFFAPLVPPAAVGGAGEPSSGGPPPPPQPPKPAIALNFNFGGGGNRRRHRRTRNRNLRLRKHRTKKRK